MTTLAILVLTCPHTSRAKFITIDPCDYPAYERQWREAGCSWPVIREIERTNDYARKFGRLPWEKGKGRRK